MYEAIIPPQSFRRVFSRSLSQEQVPSNKGSEAVSVTIFRNVESKNESLHRRFVLLSPALLVRR